MPKYQSQDGNVIDVANPDLNPQLIAGLKQVPDNTIPVSTLMANNQPIPVTQPQTTPVYPVGGIDSSLPTQTLTAPEQGISDLTKQIVDLQNSMAGKSTFTAQQQNQQGLPALLATQKDLASQIDAYKVQSQALSNTASTIPSIMQQGAEGRGITAGGLAPLTAGELRKNQIEQANIASKALSIQASLYATQGKIGAAQILIDQAVAQKYGPLEENLKAKLANLDVLLKDPSISLAEKNRANAQALLLKKQDEVLAQQKQNQTDIWKVSTDAATNVANFKPTPQYPVANAAIQAIQNAKTKEQALQIAAETGLTQTMSKTASVQEYEYAKSQGYKGTYTQYQNEDANRKIAAAKAGATTIVYNGPTPGLDPNKSDPQLGGLSQNALDVAAHNYINTGTMPSLGLGSGTDTQLKRTAILNRAGELAGGDAGAERALYKANTASLGNITTKLNATNAAATTATHNLDLALTQSPQVGRTDAGYINSIIQNYQNNFTQAKELTTFETYIYTAAREYAKVTSGGAQSAQGLTDSASREASKLLNASKSPEAFKAAVQAMKADMANVTSGLQTEQQTIQNQLQNGNTNSNQTIMLSPDGKQQVNISDLTSAQIQEAKTAGWK